MAKQYGGERATYDNAGIIVKVVFPSQNFCAERTAPPMAGRAAAMRPARERRLAGPRRPGKAARGELGEGNTPVLPGPPAGGFPGVLPLAGRGKYALTCVKLRSTLSSNRGAGW